MSLESRREIAERLHRGTMARLPRAARLLHGRTKRELKPAMPVILEAADYEAWLDPPGSRGTELMRPCPDDVLETVPVSTRVNNVRNDEETIIQTGDETVPVQRDLL